MPKKTKRVNTSINSNDLSSDLNDVNNSTIQSDQSIDNLNTSNNSSNDVKNKQRALVKYKYSAKK